MKKILSLALLVFLGGVSGLHALSYNPGGGVGGSVSASTTGVSALSSSAGVAQSGGPAGSISLSIDQSFSPTWSGSHIFSTLTDFQLGATFEGSGNNFSTTDPQLQFGVGAGTPMLLNGTSGYLNTTLFGIGTTAPVVSAHVVGDNAIGTMVLDNGLGATNSTVLRIRNLGSSKLMIGSAIGNNSFGIGLSTGDGFMVTPTTSTGIGFYGGQSIAGAPSLYVKTDGTNPRAGFNTNSPGYTADVNGTMNVTTLRFSGDGTTMTSTTSFAGVSSQWTTNGSSIGYTSGWVGIGTTNPDAPLKVMGRSASFRMAIFDDNTNDTNPALISIRKNGTTYGAFGVAGSINNYWIGSSTGDTFYSAVSTSVAVIVGPPNTGFAPPIYAKVVGTTVKVGIGTSNPGATLDIGGGLNFSGTGPYVISATPTVTVNANTSNYEFGASSITLADASGTKFLLPGVTNYLPVSISTDPTNGFTSRAEPIVQVPTGKTWTITKVSATALPSGTSVQFNLDERTAAGLGSAGTPVFTVTNATAAVGSVQAITGITSFSNSSIAADNYLVATTPASGASAGGANRLFFQIWYLEQ